MAKSKKLVVPPGKSPLKTVQKVSGDDLPPFYKEGPKRPYFSNHLQFDYISKSINFTNVDRLISLALFITSILLKIPGLKEPSVVVFDEVHTVIHINKYIDGTYFNDITPPLSKLIYTLISYLVGYRGDAFNLAKSGQSYIDTGFPYLTLRLVTVVLNSLVLPLTYNILRLSNVRTLIATTTSISLLFENLTVLHSRLFMPDSLFLLGLALSAYSFKKLDTSSRFSQDWFKFLILNGISLGLTVSTKWLGFATVGWVLTLALYKTWYILSDLDISDKTIKKYVSIKFSTLLILPSLIYLSTFFIHLLLTKNFHNDASLLSSNFQRSLDFNDINDVPKYVLYGSTVTIRHDASIGGYLHSHPYPYKSGSKNQQVTIFDYKDFHNEWVVESIEEDFDYTNTESIRVKNNDKIKLRHKNTGKLLRVDDFKPPISEQEYDFEVSAYGNETYQGNKTDFFSIKFSGHGDDDYLTSFDTKFQLLNEKKRCWLLGHDLKLPEWGFNQQEIICINSPTYSLSLFYIENIKYPKDLQLSPLLETKSSHKEPSFLQKFKELNLKMVRLFQSIKSKNPNSSNPLSWPLGLTGFKYSTRPNSSLYVIGNPIIVWLTFVLVIVLTFIKFADFFKKDHLTESLIFKKNGYDFLLGWGFHLLPYLLVEGEWFLQYYIPSLYFGILLIGVTFEFIYFKNPKFGGFIILSSTILSYYFYSSLYPITFGSAWTQQHCLNAKFLETWDFRCDTYK